MVLFSEEKKGESPPYVNACLNTQADGILYITSNFKNVPEDVMEIIRMNRNGIKPESLKSEPEPSAPEFVSAVGDDSISRFDSPKRKKKRNKNRRK